MFNRFHIWLLGVFAVTICYANTECVEIQLGEFETVEGPGWIGRVLKDCVRAQLERLPNRSIIDGPTKRPPDGPRITASIEVQGNAMMANVSVTVAKMGNRDKVDKTIALRGELSKLPEFGHSVAFAALRAVHRNLQTFRCMGPVVHRDIAHMEAYGALLVDWDKLRTETKTERAKQCPVLAAKIEDLLGKTDNTAPRLIHLWSLVLAEWAGSIGDPAQKTEIWTARSERALAVAQVIPSTVPDIARIMNATGHSQEALNLLQTYLVTAKSAARTWRWQLPHAYNVAREQGPRHWTSHWRLEGRSGWTNNRRLKTGYVSFNRKDICAIDWETGKVLWKQPLNYRCWKPAFFVKDDKVYHITPGEYVCLNRETGDVIHRLKLNSTPFKGRYDGQGACKAFLFNQNKTAIYFLAWRYYRPPGAARNSSCKTAIVFRRINLRTGTEERLAELGQAHGDDLLVIKGCVCFIESQAKPVVAAYNLKTGAKVKSITADDVRQAKRDRPKPFRKQLITKPTGEFSTYYGKRPLLSYINIKTGKNIFTQTNRSRQETVIELEDSLIVSEQNRRIMRLDIRDGSLRFLGNLPKSAYYHGSTPFGLLTYDPNADLLRCGNEVRNPKYRPEDLVEAEMVMGRSLVNIGEHAKAHEQFTSLAKRRVRLPDAVLESARALIQGGRQHESLMDYDTYLGLVRRFAGNAKERTEAVQVMQRIAGVQRTSYDAIWRRVSYQGGAWASPFPGGLVDGADPGIYLHDGSYQKVQFPAAECNGVTAGQSVAFFWQRKRASNEHAFVAVDLSTGVIVDRLPCRSTGSMVVLQDSAIFVDSKSRELVIYSPKAEPKVTRLKLLKDRTFIYPRFFLGKSSCIVSSRKGKLWYIDMEKKALAWERNMLSAKVLAMHPSHILVGVQGTNRLLFLDSGTGKTLKEVTIGANYGHYSAVPSATSERVFVKTTSTTGREKRRPLGKRVAALSCVNLVTQSVEWQTPGEELVKLPHSYYSAESEYHAGFATSEHIVLSHTSHSSNSGQMVQFYSTKDGSYLGTAKLPNLREKGSRDLHIDWGRNNNLRFTKDGKVEILFISNEEEYIKYTFADAVGFSAFIKGPKLGAGGNKPVALPTHDHTVLTSQQLTGHEGAVQAIVFDSDSKHLHSVGDDGFFKSWPAKEWNKAISTKASEAKIAAITLTRAGKIVCGGQDRSIKVWEPKSRKQLQELKGHTKKITALVASPTKDVVASGSLDKTVRLWDLTSSKTLWTSTLSRAPRVLSISSDGNVLAVGAYDRKIYLIDVATGKPLGNLVGHEFAPRALCFADEGKTLFSCADDLTIRRWDLKTQKLVKKVTYDASPVTSIAFDKKKNELLSCDWIGKLHRLDPVTLQIKHTINSQETGLRCMAYSAEKHLVALGSREGKIVIIKLP